MTARSTFESSVVSAGAAKLVTLGAAEATKQETINQSGCNAGYYSGKGGSGETAFQAAITAAAAALASTRFNAEVQRQKTADAAREVLRATGDLAPL